MAWGILGFVSAKEGEADNVPYGFYKREVLDEIGFMDEQLVRAQDYNFNRRIIASGGSMEKPKYSRLLLQSAKIMGIYSELIEKQNY